MSQIKLAAILVMPLAFWCSIATAQEQPQDCTVSSAPASQPGSPVVAAKDEVYGRFVPYKGPSSKPQARCDSHVVAADATQKEQATSSSVHETPPASQPSPAPATATAEVFGSYVPYVAPATKLSPAPIESSELKKAAPAPSKSPEVKKTNLPARDENSQIKKAIPAEIESAKTPPPACGPTEYKVDEVYGSYVPYTGPPACHTASEQVANNTPPPANASVRQTNASQVAAKSLVSGQLQSVQPISSAVALAIAPEPAAGEPSGADGFIRTIPVPPPAPPPEKEIAPDRPLRNLIIGIKGNTLGAGIEIATPVSRTLYLRSSYNVLAFDYPFIIDGVNYNARLHFKSSATTLDWYPSKRKYHVSSGILYVKNTLDAPASVGPGQTFKLGTQTFINSIDDPVSGYASVVYPHSIAPMVLFGFKNAIPHTGGHLSIPIELGAAYTGAPKINVILDGTACTTEGCFSFDTNTDAQKFLKQEVQKLNNDLRYLPVFPIVSLGLAYHF